MLTHSFMVKNPGVVGALLGGVGVAMGFGVAAIILSFNPSLWLVQALLGASLLGALWGTVLRSSYPSMRWDVFGAIVGGLVSAIGFPLLLVMDRAAWFVEKGLSIGQAFETTIGMIHLTDFLRLEVTFLLGWYDAPITLVWICVGFIIGTIVQFVFKRVSAAKSVSASQ